MLLHFTPGLAKDLKAAVRAARKAGLRPASLADYLPDPYCREIAWLLPPWRISSAPGPVVVDGGLSTQLARLGQDISGTASGPVARLLENPAP